MSNNKSSFGLNYCSHVKPNNHHMFITTCAYAIILNMDLPFGWSIFTEITCTILLIFQNKLWENIHHPPIFYTFLKNTQFLHFLAWIHLKLHFFSLFHFRLESVKKTNGNLKKWPFYPQNENYNFTLKMSKIIRFNNEYHYWYVNEVQKNLNY